MIDSNDDSSTTQFINAVHHAISAAPCNPQSGEFTAQLLSDVMRITHERSGNQLNDGMCDAVR